MNNHIGMTQEEIDRANAEFDAKMAGTKTVKLTKQEELGHYMRDTRGLKMNDWQKGFISNVCYKKYLSEKQQAIVNELYNKLIGE